MTAGSLTSDHVNYLVWRYLQESGHGEAAVKLQRDWNRNPQSLPFAQYIKTHALVSLVQKGLQYHEIEQTIDQYGNRIQPSSSMFFFGPHSGPLPLPNEEVDEDSFCQPSSVTKKHGRDAEINGIEFDQSTQHPSKKSRRSKSQGAESNEPNDHGDAMDIDRNGYSHAEPSPKADTPAPSSPAAEAEVAQELQELQEPEPTNTLTNGNSVGVQSDKVIELGPETCLFLDLGETKGNPTTNGTSSNKNHDDATSYDRGIIGSGTTNGLGANGVGGVGPSGGNVGVTHLAWNPRDPAILATAGNALSRIWTLNGLASTTENGGHVNINGNGFDDAAQTNGHTLETEGTDYINLIASSERSLTTACSWSPDGETLAVATRDLTAHWDGEATIWSRDGRMLHVLPAGHDMMLALQWNPVASLLLGIATTGESSTILLWDSSTGQLLTESTSTESLTDAAWMTETDFVCCGDTRMMRYRISIDGATPTILVLQDIKTEVKWLGLRCDVAQDIIASIADEDGLIGIVRRSTDLSVHRAHEATITGYEFGPTSKWFTDSTDGPTPSSCLATASLDGKVRLWKVDVGFELVLELSMGPSVPAMATSFSPDGSLIAAASYRKVLIWNAEKGKVPIASWHARTEKWPTEEEMAETGEEHLLKWQIHGGRLVYGLGSQLAVIDFER